MLFTPDIGSEVSLCDRTRPRRGCASRPDSRGDDGIEAAQFHREILAADLVRDGRRGCPGCGPQGAAGLTAGAEAALAAGHEGRRG